MCVVCTPTCNAREAVGVDVLSHQKKAAFWRELVELFPNLIDYLCNPNVQPVPLTTPRLLAFRRLPALRLGACLACCCKEWFLATVNFGVLLCRTSSSPVLTSKRSGQFTLFYGSRIGCNRRFYKTHISSPEDTAEEEVDADEVGSALWSSLRFQFRGAVCSPSLSR